MEGENINNVLEKYWELRRSENQVLIVGETLVPYKRFDKEEQYLIDQLNRFDPFDFKYLPKEGDKLSLKWNDGKQYFFVFHDFQWVLD